MNSHDVVDLSFESPDEDSDIQLVDVSCGIPKYLDINLESEDIIPEFAEFIKKCINIENSKGMLRVIKRSLIRVYQEASLHYIKSPEFIKSLQETAQLLDTRPCFKFSYIKLLCEKLRLNKKKKRADLITLGPYVKRKIESSNSKNKRKRIEIIDLDNIEDEDSPDQNEIIDLDCEKENKCLDDILVDLEDDLQILDDAEIDVQIDHDKSLLNNSNKSPNNNLRIEIENGQLAVEVEKNEKENRRLLKVQRFEQVDTEEDGKTVGQKIKQIEQHIAMLKVRIEKLEEAEVNDNSFSSPYVQSELLKGKVVNLYKELCELTDSQPVKRHEIRLTVTDGHAEGPARILENLLNKNLRSNGYPPFPTFKEVKMCVVIANQRCNLEWRPMRIFQEAVALFTQCGRALQKLRQQREWGHLQARAKRQHCHDDPADHDADLMARLEANRQIAINKETDIIERYASLEHENAKGVQNENGTSQNENHSMRSDDSDSGSDSDSDIVWEDFDSIVQGELFKPIAIKDEIKRENGECELDSTVKQEGEVKKEDIYTLLDDLGDDFTTSIVDIEDPFLTVEISDSSDEEVL